MSQVAAKTWSIASQQSIPVLVIYAVPMSPHKIQDTLIVLVFKYELWTFNVRYVWSRISKDADSRMKVIKTSSISRLGIGALNSSNFRITRTNPNNNTNLNKHADSITNKLEKSSISISLTVLSSCERTYAQTVACIRHKRRICFFPKSVINKTVVCSGTYFHKTPTWRVHGTGESQ